MFSTTKEIVQQQYEGLAEFSREMQAAYHAVCGDDDSLEARYAFCDWLAEHQPLSPIPVPPWATKVEVEASDFPNVWLRFSHRIMAGEISVEVVGGPMFRTDAAGVVYEDLVRVYVDDTNYDQTVREFRATAVAMNAMDEHLRLYGVEA
ncbi:hypothetical protein GCM10027568_11090 [Humibacter soli]